MSDLFYDYSQSKKYCEDLGLVWLGDDFVRHADTDAAGLAFSQSQVDAAMRHHLHQVRWLFTPQNYGLWGRIKVALYFLFGSYKPKIVTTVYDHRGWFIDKKHMLGIHQSGMQVRFVVGESSLDAFITRQLDVDDKTAEILRVESCKSYIDAIGGKV